MKAPVGLSSRRPVCEANAVRSAQQGHSDFDALEPRKRGCSPLLTPKGWAPPEKTEDLLTVFSGSADLKPLSRYATAPLGGANPLSHLAALDASSPEGGAFRQLPVSRAKPPPSGEVDLRSKDGEGSALLLQAEASPRSATLAQQAALQMPLTFTTPLVKMRLERSAERDKREIINILSAEYVQQRRRPPPAVEAGRSCWGSGQQDARAAQGTMRMLGAATRKQRRTF